MMNLFLFMYVLGMAISHHMSKYFFEDQKEVFYSIGATDKHIKQAYAICSLFSWGMVLLLAYPCLIIYRRKKSTSNHN